MPPSRHSSSSHSSSYSSSPSSHSSSSHSSSYSTLNIGYRPTLEMDKPFSNSKPYKGVGYFSKVRTKQPKGYLDYSKVIGYQCCNHEYVYYPEDWTDSESGIEYKHGYYDEKGNRYETLILKHNAKYENVPLKCEYCGTTVVRDLTDDTQTMKCDSCGATMIIDNAILDERVSDEVLLEKQEKRNKKDDTIIVLMTIGVVSIFIAAFIFLAFIGDKFYRATHYEPQSTVVETPVQSTNLDLYGKEIYLVKDSISYHIVDSKDNTDKVLYYSYNYDSYYDKDTDCYIWYNTDIVPAQWQYWYEGISSDYGDYGWMEYDKEEGMWYIEVDNTVWTPLDTTKYDVSSLWYINED